MFFYQFIINVLKEAGGSVAAAQADYGVDFRVAEHGVNIGKSLTVGPGEIPVFLKGVFAKFDLVAMFFKNLYAILNGLGAAWRARRCNYSNSHFRFKTKGLD
jgi:hypothetical protein